MAYTQVATIATDEHHTLQEFRASVGAQWPFLSDPGRIVQQDLDIQEYTDPDHNPMIPHTLVLKPGLVIHSIYNGYWFWGRPSVDDLWRDLRDVDAGDPPRLGPEHARAARGLGRRRPLDLPRLGPPCCGGLRRRRRCPRTPEPPRGHRSVRDEDRKPGLRQRQGRSRPHHVELQGAGTPVVDERAGLQPGVVGDPPRFDVRGHGRRHRQPGVGLEQGGAAGTPAGERLGVEVDPDLVDASVRAGARRRRRPAGRRVRVR